jgi:hypothetical protein
MFMHATSFNATAKGIESYATQKSAATLRSKRLTVFVFQRSAFVVCGKLLVAALDDPRRAKDAERKIRGFGGKDNERFCFSLSRWETRRTASANSFREKGQGIWFVHAEAMIGCEQVLERNNFAPFLSQVFKVWSRPEKKRSLVVVSNGTSVLIVGMKSDEVHELALQLGITRHPEKLSRPSRVTPNILHSQGRVMDPLLS